MSIRFFGVMLFLCKNYMLTESFDVFIFKIHNFKINTESLNMH